MKTTILNTRRAFTQVNEDDDGSIEYTVYLKLSKKYFLAKSIEHANAVNLADGRLLQIEDDEEIVPAECMGFELQRIDGACK